MNPQSTIVPVSGATCQLEPVFQTRNDHFFGSSFLDQFDDGLLARTEQLAEQQRNDFSQLTTTTSSTTERKLSEPARNTDPYLEIIVQPKSEGYRFRYESERPTAGSLHGENSTLDHVVFPTVKIRNMDSTTAIIVVSTVTNEDPPGCTPHPHSLTGEDCSMGVCTKKLKNTSIVTFPHIGIQCTRRKDVISALQERRECNIDPFHNSITARPDDIDLSSLRLCFQTFLPDDDNRMRRKLPPVVSKPIYAQKINKNLKIVRMSTKQGKVEGGDEIFVFVSKVKADDIKVKFTEESLTRNIPPWEAEGKFGITDVHHSFAIVLRTPAYHDQTITASARVKISLFRPSDNAKSESVDFTYLPSTKDEFKFKRLKKMSFQTDLSKLSPPRITNPLHPDYVPPQNAPAPMITSIPSFSHVAQLSHPSSTVMPNPLLSQINTSSTAPQLDMSVTNDLSTIHELSLGASDHANMGDNADDFSQLLSILNADMDGLAAGAVGGEVAMDTNISDFSNLL